MSMTAHSIWQKLHQIFSSSFTTRIMSLKDHLKLRKLTHQSMRDYLNGIQTTGDSLASYGNPIEEIQQILTILNGVNGQFDHIAAFIHASQNPYDITYVCSVLMDAETRQRDLMFDVPPSINIASNNTLHRSVTDSDSSSTTCLAAHHSAARPDSSPQVQLQTSPALAQTHHATHQI